MDEKKIQEIEDQLLKNMNDEQMAEDEIEGKSKEIASHLMAKNVVKADIDGRVFTFKYRTLKSKMPEQVGTETKMVDVDVIFMIIVNDAKYKIAGSEYTPFTANAVVEKAWPFEKNLEKVIETFIRHITGHVKVEELEG